MAENQILKKAGLPTGSSGGGDSDMSLEQVVSVAVAEDAIKATGLASDLKTSQNQAKAIQGDLVEGIKSSASNDVITQVAEQTAQLQVQNQSNAILQAAGGTEAQVTLMTQLNEQGNKVDSILASSEDIMDDEHTGLSIIDGVINSFRNIDNRIQLKHAVASENHTVNRINNVSAAQESFARTNSLNKQSLNEAVIAANSRKIEQLATIDAQKQELTNLHNNSAALLTINQADAGVTRSLLQAYELQGKTEARAIQREQIEFRRESMVQQRAEWETRKPMMKAQLETAELNLATARATNPSAVPAQIAKNEQISKEIAAGLELEKQQVEQVQRAQAAANSPVETAEVINKRFATPATRQRYIDLQVIGSSENPTYGVTPAEAFKNFRTVIDPTGNLPLTPKTAVLKEISDKQQAAYAASKVGKVPKDEETLMADYDANAQAVMISYASDIKAGDQTNPYQAPPMEVLAGKKSVAESVLYQKVLADQNLTEVVPQQIMDHALNGIRAGLVSPEEAAAGIDTLFTAAAVHNNTNMGGFQRVGLGEFNQISYLTQVVNTPTAFDTLKVAVGLTAISASPFAYVGDPVAKQRSTYLQGSVNYQTVDLMNDVQVKAALVKAQSAHAQAKLNTESGLPGSALRETVLDLRGETK